MKAKSLPWIERVSESELVLRVSLGLYSRQALCQACYWLTEHCFVYLEPGRNAQEVRVHLAPKDEKANLGELAGQFGNELLDQQLRGEISAETRPIRELIVAQAFVEAELGDQRGSDYGEDPEGIGK